VLHGCGTDRFDIIDYDVEKVYQEHWNRKLQYQLRTQKLKEARFGFERFTAARDVTVHIVVLGNNLKCTLIGEFLCPKSFLVFKY
jgi:hypothetical protein